MLKRNLFVCFFLSFLLAYSQSNSKEEISCYKNIGLDNSILNVKLDLTRGGAICYISKSGETRNLVNIHDEGRYVQHILLRRKTVE